jgi:lactonase family protein with 7-bladed beta-propeller
MKMPARRLSPVCVFAMLFGLTVVTSNCGSSGSSVSSSQPASPAPSGSQPPASGGSGGTGGGSGSGGSSGSPGSSGGSGGAGATGGASTTAALAYVTGNNAFYGIRVDSSSNVSTVSGSPYAVTGNIMGFATSGKLLFVSTVASDFKNGAITSYRADDNGALTQLGTTTAANSGGMTVASDSTGKFLYGTAEATQAGQAGTQPAIFGFSIDASSGTLTALPGSPYFLNGGMGPADKPVVTPNGSWVCVSMELARTNEGAQCYTRHADGSVDGKNFVFPNGSDTGIQGLAATNDSTMLLFTNGEQNEVISTVISNTKNAQTYPSGGSFSNGIAVSPTAHWAVVANRDSGDLAVFETGAGGLAPTSNAAKAGTSPNRVAFSHSGTYVFVTTAGGTLVYSQDANTGALTPVNASNPAPGNGSEIGTM